MLVYLLTLTNKACILSIKNELGTCDNPLGFQLTSNKGGVLVCWWNPRSRHWPISGRPRSELSVKIPVLQQQQYSEALAKNKRLVTIVKTLSHPSKDSSYLIWVYVHEVDFTASLISVEMRLPLILYRIWTSHLWTMPFNSFLEI